MLRELPSSLDALLLLCIKVDDRVCARRSSHAGASTAAHGPRESDTGEGEEPMQLECSQLSLAERQCHLSVFIAATRVTLFPTVRNKGAPISSGENIGG